METQKITLTRDRAQTVLHAVQGEANAQTFAFSLTDSRGAAVELTDDMSALFYVDKNDGNPVQVAAEIDTDSQTVNVPLTVQATTAAGNHDCQLQVYTEDEDIWRSSITLSVAANPATNIPSRPEFCELTTILQNADTAQRLAEYYLTVADSFSEVLGNYTEGISPSKTGTAPMPNEQDRYTSALAYDTSGNLLMMDAYSYGAVNTMLSVNNGESWQSTPLNGSTNASFSHCIGGDKFLCIGRTNMMWAEVSNSKLTHGTVLDSPFKGRSSQIMSGKYAGGKYWVFYHSATSAVYPPAYLMGNGTAYATVTLPDSKMVAHDVAYNVTDGVYYFVGGYDPYEDEVKACHSWIAKTADLKNFEVVADLAYTSYAQCYADIFGDYLVMLHGDKKTRINLVTGDKRTTTFSFAATGLRATEYGIAAVGSDSIAFSKTTAKFYSDTIANNISGVNASNFAAHGRYMAVAIDNAYAIYRVDLAGDKMLDDLADAQKLLDELETAAGRKIVCTDTDPGLGTVSSESDGTLIMVYSGQMEADT